MKRFLLAVITATTLLVAGFVGVPAHGAPDTIVDMRIGGPPSIPLHSHSQFDAWAIREDGRMVNVTAEAVWLSSRPDIIAVIGPGVFEGRAAGRAYVAAEYGDYLHGFFVEVSRSFSDMTVKAKRATVGLDTVIRYEATLTQSTHHGEVVGPIPGETVTFTAPSGHTACTAVTNTGGVAACQVKYDPVSAVLGLVFPKDPRYPPPVGATFSAAFGGNPETLGTQATGKVT